ncbi:MAG: response regulator [Nibricoccus sp.]
MDRPIDCCVLDLRLPDMSGFELLDRIQSDPSLRDIPIVVFTGKDLNLEEEKLLRTMAKSILVKDVQSPERLFDETALFLHRVVSDLPEAKQQMLDRLHASNDVLKGRKVLIVDDDARNIFALTTMLENQEMDVISATNGRQAIELIQQQPELGVVLMDIMMPEMDGYQTMREIRKDPRFTALPILALTAKAMKGDREKCLAAGATDYIAKPVNTERTPLAPSRLAPPMTSKEPVLPAQPRNAVNSAHPLDLAAAAPVSLLIVDDEPRNLDVLESILTPSDYRLVRAVTAEKALRELLEGDFAAIILDIQMPEMSGIELANLIKQRCCSDSIVFPY